jgi:hypothetical protein
MLEVSGINGGDVCSRGDDHRVNCARSPVQTGINVVLGKMNDLWPAIIIFYPFM